MECSRYSNSYKNGETWCSGVSNRKRNSTTFATKHVPERVPKRWDLISNVVSDYSITHKENKIPSVILKQQEDGESCKVKVFDTSSSGCKEAVNQL